VESTYSETLSVQRENQAPVAQVQERGSSEE